MDDFLRPVIEEAARDLLKGGIPIGPEFIRAHPFLWAEDIEK